MSFCQFFIMICIYILTEGINLYFIGIHGAEARIIEPIILDNSVNKFIIARNRK